MKGRCIEKIKKIITIIIIIIIVIIIIIIIIMSFICKNRKALNLGIAIELPSQSSCA